jgi:hypothetical protein
MLVLLCEHPAATGVGERKFRPKRDRLVEIGESMIEVAKLGIGVAAIIEQIGTVNVDLDREIVIVQRPRVVRLLCVRPAAIMIDAREIGLELDRLGVIGDGEVVFADIGIRIDLALVALGDDPVAGGDDAVSIVRGAVVPVCVAAANANGGRMSVLARKTRRDACTVP